MRLWAALWHQSGLGDEYGNCAFGRCSRALSSSRGWYFPHLGGLSLIGSGIAYNIHFPSVIAS